MYSSTLTLELEERMSRYHIAVYFCFMRLTLCAVLILASMLAVAQEPYWQQQVNYRIHVKLDTEQKILRGSEVVVYHNHSPDTLNFIWFHLYPNAYKQSNTALFKQLRNDVNASVGFQRSSKGFIDSIQFRVNGLAAEMLPHSDRDYIDVVKVMLPQPLLPGDSAVLTTAFKVQLPQYFSRSGYSNSQFMICQWYPKAAVYDHAGWHPYPYLNSGEFYSDYGNYDVSISVPSNLIIAATGQLQDQDELVQYRHVGSINLLAGRSGDLIYPQWSNPVKTLRYLADSVIDFAWFADPAFVIQYDTIALASGKIIDAFSFYHPGSRKIWNESMIFLKDATKKYSSWIGDYGYPLVQVVEGPLNESSGGMEYPMVTLITSRNAGPERLDATIAHEVGHNWFMAMLGTNERLFAWMDEGFNSYFQFRYEAEKYQSNLLFSSMGLSVPNHDPDAVLRLLYTMISEMESRYAINTPAQKFRNSYDYATTEYLKAALWVYSLELSVGRDELDRAFRNYFAQWKFKHPGPADLKRSLENALGKKLDDFFNLLEKKGKL